MNYVRKWNTLGGRQRLTWLAIRAYHLSPPISSFSVRLTWPSDLQKYKEVLPWGEVCHEELRYELLEGHELFVVIGAGDVLFLSSSKHTVLHVEVVNCSGARAGLRKRVSVAWDCSAIRTGSVLLDQQRSITLARRQRWGDRTGVLIKSIGLNIN